MKNNIMIILPIVFIFDLLIPFILAPTYKGYNHLTQVMSVLGNSKAPLHNVYNAWLIVFGIILIVINFKVYTIVSECSSLIAIILFTILLIYAIGGVYSFWDILCWVSKKSCYSFRKNTWLWLCYWFYVLNICTTFRRNLFIQNKQH